MAKTSRKQIIEDEKKVIKELQKNARESIDNITKRCKFSRQKVWRIIDRLEENKTIWGYNAVVDDEKLNQKRYLILIKRSNVPMGDTVEKIVNLVMHKRGEEVEVNITCSSYLHGLYDWLLYVTAPDIKQVKKFSEILTHEYQDIIKEIHIMEDIFPIKKCGIVNPNKERLREFL